MTRALREIHRVLRPGEHLLIMNEPLCRPTDPGHGHAAQVARYAGNEHVHFFPQYLWVAWHAGFHHIHVTEPAYDAFYSHDPIHLTL